MPPTVTHAIGRVESEALRMQVLVEDLLLLARLDAGRPLEVFADGQKTGSTMAAFIDDACIVISIALQHGVAPAALARSLSTVPVWVNGVKGEGPASPVGAILAALEPAPPMPWAAT